MCNHYLKFVSVLLLWLYIIKYCVIYFGIDLSFKVYSVIQSLILNCFVVTVGYVLFQQCVVGVLFKALALF